MKRLLFVTLGLLAATAAFACSDEKEDGQSTNTTPTGDTPEALFRAVQADLVKTCGGVGGACHVDGKHQNPQGDAAARWLGPGDPYLVAKAYPGIVPITNDPRDSKLLTQIEHEGPALVSIPTLFEGVRKWVTAEVAAAGATHPVTEAFYVKKGPNSVSLGALAAGAEGAQLTFTADEVDGTVFLSDMKVTAGARAIRMTNATLVILPATGPTRIDALGGFHGDLVVKGGETASFYSGETILQKWNALNKLKLVFDRFEVVDVSVPEAGVSGCKAVDAFVANAGPAFKLDLGDGTTCVTCHGATNAAPGSAEEVAVTTLDLRALDTTPAEACANALMHVNLADRPNSNLLKTPAGAPGGDPTHPVRGVCGGGDPDGGSATPLCVPPTYASGVLAWINAE